MMEAMTFENQPEQEEVQATNQLMTPEQKAASRDMDMEEGYQFGRQHETSRALVRNTRDDAESFGLTNAKVAFKMGLGLAVRDQWIDFVAKTCALNDVRCHSTEMRRLLDTEIQFTLEGDAASIARVVKSIYESGISHQKGVDKYLETLLGRRRVKR